MNTNIRVAAARATLKIVEQGRSLQDAVPRSASALEKELVYGVVRWYWRLYALAGELLDSPLRKKDLDVMVLILVGLYQLSSLKVPHHAAINETVAACGPLGKPWAKGLVNAILRGYLRKRTELGTDLSDEARYSHPQWLLERMQQSWPQHWRTIADANNLRPPMVLRVNRLRLSRSAYLQTLRSHGVDAKPDPLSDDGVILTEATAVAELPGFGQGHFSVQDTAAQWAAQVLPVAPSARILDACAAPGGKLTHLLEAHPCAQEVVAIEVDGERACLIEENLRRLGVTATVIVADAADVRVWWDGREFDCLLVDAPCSGTGVIRRRPDIKHHRQPGDLAKLVDQQAVILDRLWQTLRPGGYMLYITCSILEEENDEQIDRFLSARSDARTRRIELPAGVTSRFGVQTLPGLHEVDGFYYALMRKAGS